MPSEFNADAVATAHAVAIEASRAVAEQEGVVIDRQRELCAARQELNLRLETYNDARGAVSAALGLPSAELAFETVRRSSVSSRKADDETMAEQVAGLLTLRDLRMQFGFEPEGADGRLLSDPIDAGLIVLSRTVFADWLNGAVRVSGPSRAPAIRGVPVCYDKHQEHPCVVYRAGAETDAKRAAFDAEERSRGA